MGRPRLQYINQVARNTGADSYRKIKKWLATIPDGKLPTNQKTEGKEEVYHPSSHTVNFEL